jgi:hypothetical protein
MNRLRGALIGNKLVEAGPQLAASFITVATVAIRPYDLRATAGRTVTRRLLCKALVSNEVAAT